MELIHIKANNKYYHPMKKGIQNPTCWDGIFYDVCFIKKLWFGVWRVDYYDQDEFKQVTPLPFPFHSQSNQIPNVRIYLYPSGIQEVKYKK